MKRIAVLFFLLILFAGCQQPEARWPVGEKGASFLKLSAERNRRLLQREEALLDQLIAGDSLHAYRSSANGLRYYYLEQADTAASTPVEDDQVTLTYDLLTWDNDTIYRADEIGLVRYRVDKQELFSGLRSAVKLLREGETAVFFYPSSLAFGYHGDDARIGPNVPLKSTVTLLDLEKHTDSLSPNP